MRRDNDDYPPPLPQRSRPADRPGFGMRNFFGLVMMGVWGVLFFGILLGGFAFVASASKATSAIQEAALGATFSTFFIGAYILARCLEKVAASLEKASGRDAPVRR